MLYVGGPFVLKLPAFTDPQSGALAAPTFGTITIRRNGATDTAISGTITTLSTGAYEVTSGSVVPGSWSAGDLISAFVNYTYGGASGGVWTNQETVDVTVASRLAAGGNVANVTGTVAVVTTAIDALTAITEEIPSDTNSLVGANVQGQLNTMFGTNGSQIDNIETLITAVKKLLRADKKINKTGSPWTVQALDEGTADVLMEKDLFDVDGTALTSVNTKPGRAIQT